MRVFLCALTIGFLVPLAALAAPENLKFNPPDSVKFTVKSVSVRDQWIDTTHGVLDSTVATTKDKLRRVPGGYELQSVMTQYSGNRNNIPFDTSLIKVMTGLTTTLTIDSNGEATGITGYEAVWDKVDKISDRATASGLKEALSPRLMADRDVNDWNERMTFLVGRQFVLKALKINVSPLMLPDEAKLQLHEVSFIRDTTRTNGRLYATLHTISDTDPSRLAIALHQDVGFIKKLFNLTDSTIATWSKSVSRYQTVTDIVFDATTLLVQSERTSRQVVMKQVDLPEQKVISRVAETTERTFTYGK